MNKIVICIPTYKRGDMLRQLIDTISKCMIDKSLIKSINIVVVDNDVEKTAQELITKLKIEYQTFFDLHYHNYSIKGLANVRNELITRAMELNPDFLVFIDDDEYVTENWLVELLKTVIENDGDAARGPVLPKYDNKVSISMEALLERESYANNTLLGHWTTGNLIIRRTSLDKYNVRFDKRFNSTGSEDYFFGRQMAAKGAKIYWAANAITYEIIPEKRTELNWFLKRAYRGAGMYMFVLKLEKDYVKIANKIIISVVYIFVGLFSLILIIFPIRKRFWGIMKIADGIGALTAVFNLHYNEYK